MLTPDARYWVVHVFFLFAVIYSKFDTAVISVVIIAAIFSNLGQSSNSEHSAYSIFNKGCRYLLGEARPQDVDKQMRGGHDAPIHEEPSGYEGLSVPSKFANKPCICGSGLKGKKCCMAPTRPVKTVRVPEKRTDFGGFTVVAQG